MTTNSSDELAVLAAKVAALEALLGTADRNARSALSALEPIRRQLKEQDGQLEKAFALIGRLAIHLIARSQMTPEEWDRILDQHALATQHLEALRRPATR